MKFGIWMKFVKIKIKRAKICTKNQKKFAQSRFRGISCTIYSTVFWEDCYFCVLIGICCQLWKKSSAAGKGRL